ncbi:MAG: IS4 family transposase [Planctomycetales bacterium]
MSELLAEQEVRGTRTVQVKAQPNQLARTAKVEMRHVRIVMPRPRNVSPWVKDNGTSQIAMSTVQSQEPNPPKGCQPLNWILLTSDQVKGPSQSRRVIEDYEQRPVVEELHKAAKTGCRVEQRQYQTSARLERVTAVQCVVAVRLLQLRTHARLTPERPAIEVVPEQWVRVISGVRHGSKRRDSVGMTVPEIYRELAKLGGFVGRKSDGEPRWITLWRGFEKLQLILRGINYYDTTCG